MSKEVVTFRLDADKRAALDSVAELLQRDRSHVLNEAVSAYLETHEWQIAHLKEGYRQAEAGEFASDEEVARAFRRRSE